MTVPTKTWYQLEYGLYVPHDPATTAVITFAKLRELAAWKKASLYPGVVFQITKHTEKLVGQGVH